MMKGELVMEKDILLEKIEMECPICGQLHSIEKRSRKSGTIIKDEKVEFSEVYFLCSNAIGSDYSEFVPGSILNENLLEARNAYRRNHGLLTSDEIKDIRQLLDLTQAELSLILNMGEVTISRFETKAIQTKVLDDAIREAKDNKAGLLRKLFAKKDSFELDRFAYIEKHIKQLIEDETFEINSQTITLLAPKESFFSKYNEFMCFEAVWDISSDYDLLPAINHVSLERTTYYQQAHCRESVFYNAAA